MLVVADTSPINYLVLIGQIDLLKHLYGRVLAPPAVYAELTHPLAPGPVRSWAASTPVWLEVLTPARNLVIPHLDAGETEALALAIESAADLLLIDEREGRQEAARRGLKVAGTLAVLDEAGAAGLVDFAHSVIQLRDAGFRVSPAVLDEIVRRRSR